MTYFVSAFSRPSTRASAREGLWEEKSGTTYSRPWRAECVARHAVTVVSATPLQVAHKIFHQSARARRRGRSMGSRYERVRYARDTAWGRLVCLLLEGAHEPRQGARLACFNNWCFTRDGMVMVRNSPRELSRFIAATR